jgi:hypothetical protein
MPSLEFVQRITRAGLQACDGTGKAVPHNGQREEKRAVRGSGKRLPGADVLRYRSGVIEPL